MYLTGIFIHYKNLNQNQINDLFFFSKKKIKIIRAGGKSRGANWGKEIMSDSSEGHFGHIRRNLSSKLSLTRFVLLDFLSQAIS